MQVNGRKVVVWGFDDGDDLTAESPDEVIEDFLSYICACKSDWPESVTVYGFARMQATVNEMTRPLEDVIEHLDETYGDPEGFYVTPITDAMKEAEKKLLEVVAAEYKPWACERVTSETINVMEWVKENNPEWLEEEE